jgi:ribosome-binding ATPase YchF (GTP1/OBG family)
LILLRYDFKDIKNLADNKDRMIMCSSEMESELFQKQYSFRNESRKRSIEQMKSQVRKEIRAINHVNELIETLPKEMTEAQ